MLWVCLMLSSHERYVHSTDSPVKLQNALAHILRSSFVFSEAVIIAYILQTRAYKHTLNALVMLFLVFSLSPVHSSTKSTQAHLVGQYVITAPETQTAMHTLTYRRCCKSAANSI